MRLNKSISRRNKIKKAKPIQTPTLELDTWQFTTNDAGDLVVRNSESGEEIIIARK